VLWIGPSLGIDILEPYQRARITAFLDPTVSPPGAAYNSNQ
jgi:cell division protein FtsW (lipid II flippase)